MSETTKTIRVFVSSTFIDMQAEWCILQKDVFPSLKALCEGNGASFQDVDLRWGASEEAQLDQTIMDICLAEIARYQGLSPESNFITLLDDKHEWQPIPAKIPSVEMELAHGELADDEAFVATWYREDTNARPPKLCASGAGRCASHLQGLAEDRKRTTSRIAFGGVPTTFLDKDRLLVPALGTVLLRFYPKSRDEDRASKAALL